MENKEKKSRIVHDVEAVITSYNQGVMIQELFSPYVGRLRFLQGLLL